ncbi:hypothetical protein Acsp06_02000 [Actinomycetospora sp. NBRC 106375]|nr:hypothetical protein Acsp06_02000 [Actinomycetospora sp. NBRC 106375]
MIDRGAGLRNVLLVREEGPCGAERRAPSLGWAERRCPSLGIRRGGHRACCGGRVTKTPPIDRVT